MDNNQELITIRDLAVAAFLHSHEVCLDEVKPLDSYRCAFVFVNEARIPGLIAQWGTDGLNANGREFWSSYRHLLGLAKDEERKVKEVSR